ncbi:hypothetical protein EVAR_24372_1 [Eumeta japonica]|uniref:Uncharacterized protein n=1 Tax=Eumeta variegata TaxID=151549 RepID=A0A4C1Y882_EUMVA|nr:hypothetical protein EVAR_24372_1 [Eumeta japonica]
MAIYLIPFRFEDHQRSTTFSWPITARPEGIRRWEPQSRRPVSPGAAGGKGERPCPVREAEGGPRDLRGPLWALGRVPPQPSSTVTACACGSVRNQEEWVRLAQNKTEMKKTADELYTNSQKRTLKALHQVKKMKNKRLTGEINLFQISNIYKCILVSEAYELRVLSDGTPSPLSVASLYSVYELPTQIVMGSLWKCILKKMLRSKWEEMQLAVSGNVLFFENFMLL